MAVSAVRNGAIVLAMVAAGSVLAYMHVASQVYYPVVRIASPDGVSYTALMDPTDDRRDCGAANERFLGPVKSQCQDCKVVFARCERKSEAIDLAIHHGEPVRLHWVVLSGLRIAVVGPEETAKAICDQIAGVLLKGGLRSSGCLHPG